MDSIGYRKYLSLGLLVASAACLGPPPPLPQPSSTETAATSRGDSDSTLGISTTARPGMTSVGGTSSVGSLSASSTPSPTEVSTTSSSSGSSAGPGSWDIGTMPGACEDDPADGDCAACSKAQCCPELESCEASPESGCPCMLECTEYSLEVTLALMCASKCNVDVSELLDPMTEIGALVQCAQELCPKCM